MQPPTIATQNMFPHKRLQAGLSSSYSIHPALCCYQFARLGHVLEVLQLAQPLLLPSLPQRPFRATNHDCTNFLRFLSFLRQHTSTLVNCFVHPIKRHFYFEMASIEISEIENVAQTLRQRLNLRLHYEPTIITANSGNYRESIARWSLAAEKPAVSVNTASLATLLTSSRR